MRHLTFLTPTSQPHLTSSHPLTRELATRQLDKGQWRISAASRDALPRALPFVLEVASEVPSHSSQYLRSGSVSEWYADLPRKIVLIVVLHLKMRMWLTVDVGGDIGSLLRCEATRVGLRHVVLHEGGHALNDIHSGAVAVGVGSP